MNRAPRDTMAWILPALAIVGLHVATARGYGIFRDELYYLACADHLAWGFVDHPPLSIAVLAIVRTLLGDSLHAIRLVPALAAGATAVLAASTARSLGGGAFAQRVAAISAAVMPIALALCGFYSMNALDLVLWTAAFRILAAILAGGDPRLWIAFGAVAGVGLQNKLSMLFMGLGVVLGLVVARRWDALLTRWIWLGGALAAAIVLPNVLWQAAHDWPTLEFMANARRYKMEGTNPLGFVVETLLNGGPLTFPVWIGGVGWLLASRASKAWRGLGWAFVAIFAVMLASGAKPYYLAPTFPLACAAGGVAWERWTDRPRMAWARPALLAVVFVGSAAVAPLAKALLPVEAYLRYSRALGITPSSGERHALGRLPQHFADMHGWKELAEAVARVRDGLPEEDRARVCVAGQNYGEAGAIDYFGPALGLPRAISGHNSYWLWGPGDCAGKVWIVIGDRRESLETIFESVERGGVFECDLCMPYEDGSAIWICRGLRGSPSALWPTIKLFI